METLCYQCAVGRHEQCYLTGRNFVCVCAKCYPAAPDDLLVAILPNGVRGFISLACSDEDCEAFIAQTRSMGASAWCRVEDTADFCEEAI